MARYDRGGQLLVILLFALARGHFPRVARCLSCATLLLSRAVLGFQREPGMEGGRQRSAPKTNRIPTQFLSVRYGVARASGSIPAVNQGVKHTPATFALPQTRRDKPIFLEI